MIKTRILISQHDPLLLETDPAELVCWFSKSWSVQSDSDSHQKGWWRGSPFLTTPTSSQHSLNRERILCALEQTNPSVVLLSPTWKEAFLVSAEGAVRHEGPRKNWLGCCIPCLLPSLCMYPLERWLNANDKKEMTQTILISSFNKCCLQGPDSEFCFNYICYFNTT